MKNKYTLKKKTTNNEVYKELVENNILLGLDISYCLLTTNMYTILLKLV